jgi:arylsulfatase A-like enzyme
LLEEDTTLPEMLAEAGYTSALFGKWHLGENDGPASWDEDVWSDHLDQDYLHELSPNSHGFTRFMGSIEATIDLYRRRERLSSWTSDAGIVTASGSLIKDYATTETSADVIDWANNQERPWFAVASFNAPHEPMDAPDASCTYTYADSALPSDDLGIYQAMVECLDQQVGEILAGIEDLDDTLVIFLGDNGTYRDFAEHVFDDGRGKATVYESGIRVPLIFTDGKAWLAAQEGFASTTDWQRSPEYIADPGREIADPVSVSDIFATLGEIAETDASTGSDSISLMPLLEDTDGDTRYLLYTEMFDSELLGAAALRVGAYKLLFSVVNDNGVRCRQGYELYNVVTDQYEETDLSQSDAVTLFKMKSEIGNLIPKMGNAWISIPDC